jgi:hypothetical protein
MRSCFLRVVPSLLVIFAAIPLRAAPPQASAPPPVRVNESSARLTLQDKSSLFSIELASTQSNLPATLTVRVLNEDDAVLFERSTDLHLTRSPQRAELTLPWSPSDSVEDAARSRLRYEVRLPGLAVPVAQGTLSPAAITPNLFELNFTGLAEVGSGGTYVAEVWATRPNSTQPVPGVDLQATIGDDDPPPPGLAAHARTNSRGQARLTFHLPEVVSEGEADIEIKGTLGNFANSVTATIHIAARGAILLSTDKPLYQPGQTLHMRAFLLNDQHRAWPKQPVTFTVIDPDSTSVFTSDVDSSRFGIASVDWSIPASQKFGTYQITAEVSGENNDRRVLGGRIVRITRYELPTFTVNVHPDQPYYLTGQNAQLTVSADYLFGKPVLRGHVRIVRESHRSWNYHEQKWDIEEAPAQEGELDAKNEFHATLDLAHDHADLLDNDYERFQDLRYAAYLTDASSGRTQERHFDIRISRDAIHLYLIVPRRSIPASFPSTVYLSSFTPDGTPASADVSIKLYSRDPQDQSNPSDLPKLLAETKVRTNRFGVAKAKLPVIPDLPKDARRLFLALQAKTLDGRTGQHLESFDLADDDYLSVTPIKAIFKPGEPIELLLEATVPKAKYRVDVIDGETWTVLASQDVSLPHGHAHLTFPPSDRFSGLLRIAAHSLTLDPQPSYSYRRFAATAGIIFPHPDDLKLDLRPLKASYRPGESATVDLRVRSPQGDATQGALGLLVYDQALEELARSEASLSTSGDDSLDPRLGFQPLQENSESFAGFSVHDLLNLPPGQSVSSDVELVAESLLFSGRDVSILSEDSTTNWGLDHLFEKNIHTTLDPLIKRLADLFDATGHFPADDAAYHKFLQQSGFDPSSLNDPWGRPYRVHRSYERINEVFEFLSDGPDKLSNTGDDFTALRLVRPFSTLQEKRLTEIASAYHSRTGDYLRDLDSFRAECEHQHSPLPSFLDPWGTPYHFEFAIQGPYYTLSATSAGPDRLFRPPDSSSSEDWDDLGLFTIRIPYFLETSTRINEALFDSANKSLHFADAADFPKILSEHGIDWNSIRDPWGHPYDVVSGVEVSYADRVAVHTYGQTQTTSQFPVTRKIKTLRIISNGPDGKPNSPDDFEVARYSSPLSDETASGTKTSSFLTTNPVFSGNSGAIRVRVLDATGAVIPNANVTATNDQTGFEATGTADNEGLCLLRNLSPGSYHVVVSMQSFQTYALQSVPVYSSNVTELEIKLSLGTTTETITVLASAPTLETSTSSMVESRSLVNLTTKSGTASGRINIPLATPRLRQYFPETLFWQPEILTDRSGHTTVKFPLADSITTWKVSAIASTLDGHVATTTKEIRAFQPFFAELDPPKVLTVGDEIHLPVTVRNYLDKPQSISLDWAPEPWAESLTPRTATTEVAPGDYAQKIFSFRAKLPMKDARQRLSAYNRSNEKESDAIERQLRIHADGQERIVQSSSVFSRDTALTLTIPPSAVPGSIEAELVLYPNLVSHVSEAIEGILHRPYGCAEQTISSAYPSLLWLQLKKSQHLPPSAYDERAQRFLNLAYARLIGYREPGGGFSYWGHGSPNLPLTAYALRFLTEASEFVSVDPDIPNQTRAWLLTQLSPQGLWQGSDYQGKFSDWLTSYYTSYVTRVLAQDLQHPTTDQKTLEAERNAVRRALEYLSTHSINENDPYRFALIVQAKLANHEDPTKELDALLSSVHPEGEQSYWAAEHNTVFYGWGYAGRIETTALALDALASAKQQGHTTPALEAALSKGTLFLLKNKDRYGIWYSTQATVNVLQSLVRQFDLDSSATAASEPARPIQIFVDGKPATTLTVSNNVRQIAPLHSDLSAFLSPGEHHVELRGAPASRASAYLAAVYYLPWTDPAVTSSSIRSGDSEALRYSVKFDHITSAIGDSILCTVHAERVGFRGYGMMLAEIGLPPGADVDRASLDALATTLYDVQSYEIQPDRVVFYLWPRAGGSTFSFSLKPRFAMSAQSAESLLYDYYNPEARASVPSTSFSIH